MRHSSTPRGVLAAALLAATVTPGGAADAPAYQESDFLTQVRRLTYEGRRAGEGYFSPDGRRIVFQAEREPGNPFFQIYELDLDTGETRRLSPGWGKTTCAFYHPEGGDLLFASSHHAPASRRLQAAELALRAAGQERRYSWDYDPQMDLYVRKGGTGELIRLTSARGYDAEGSYSPDGEWIVFTSNRSAYERPLADAAARRLEADPAYFAEIYRMRADGTAVQRLTHTPGYDGGPFFLPDGSRVVWRRFEENGLKADLWSMRPDGSDPRRLTDFGSMSWAPYPHPSGKYLFFASNKLGFENFELYIVDTEGLREPVRVTTTDGFDGLPVASPDGERLAWTSDRHGGQGQLYLGRWNHQRALEALAASPRREPGPQNEGDSR